MQITDVNTGVEILVEAIKTDYRGYMDTYAGGWNGKGEMDETQQNMVAEFENSFEVSEGKKYIKIKQKRGGVWGFVVKQDDDKFKAGDILKAAGYSAPARNAARGNVFTGYTVQWTGPQYLS